MQKKLTALAVAGLAAAEREVRAALRYGFTDAELAEQLANFKGPSSTARFATEYFKRRGWKL